MAEIDMLLFMTCLMRKRNAPFRLLLLLCLAAGMLWGCEEDEPADTQAPTIELRPDSADTIRARTDDTLQRVLILRDDAALAHFEVRIRKQFGDSSSDKRGAFPFGFQRERSIAGEAATDTLRIGIPKEAATGPYRLAVRCSDAAGNRADSLLRPLRITGPQQPSVAQYRFQLRGQTLTPAVDTFLVFRPQEDTLRLGVSGDVLAPVPQGLAEVTLSLAPVTGNGSTGAPILGRSFRRAAGDFDARRFSMAHTFVIARSAVTDAQSYRLRLRIRDRAGNYRVRDARLRVQLK